MRVLVVLVGFGAGTVGVIVGLADELIVLALAQLGNLLGLGLALVDILVVQLHGQGQHGGGALRLGGGCGRGAGDLLQAAGLGARLDLGDLVAQLSLTLLGFLKLLGQVLDLLGLLLGHDDLLLSGSQLAGQVFGTGAELITLMLHGVELLAKTGLTCGFRGLSGELIHLSGQTIHLILKLFVLSGQRTVAFLSLRELGGSDLCGLCGLIPGTGGLLGGGLQRRILLLQGLHLGIKLGNLGVEPRDIRTKRLRGLTDGDRLLAQGLNGLSYLIEEIVDFINVITFLETHGLEGMLPNIFRRQQSHKSYTSLWA